ncbi:PIG-L deacetylase family protein [Indiicoccus explosivorum]|uniref:PIG-L deacetylase family protein n=1 Tax=Indiicoccus explosivorum TaxID=1917864 RepID=UPI000B445CEB|nr:PIG-L deacetylase family protein [Indiicoccus explosivorum]
MSYLVVVAHPDDEVLGAGGTIKSLTDKGEIVNVCILCSEVEVRNYRPNIEELNEDIKEANKILGINQVFLGDFPNIALNTVKQLEIVQFIEKVMIETKTSVLITHHPADLNNDHYHVSIACQAASRLFQRRSDVVQLKELLFMEIPSSTEWALNTSLSTFSPNVFFEINQQGIDSKIKALSQYRGVMRDYPHPRSEESLRSLATYRGSQSGLMFAESYESVFRREY